ncbi:MAG: site-specific integrase [Patescibacteria group bacterium]|nr:site-specific integrase [Patescibacteria group bacterium]
MARRRYQRPVPKKVGRRWEIIVREDVADADGNVCRKQVRVTLGTTDEIATAKQAARLAEPILARINTCRPKYVIRFAEIAARYEQVILPEQKPSSQAAARSVIKKWLMPAFGDSHIHDITPEAVQSFIARIRKQVSEKTVWNVTTTLRSIWRTCLDWGYASEKIFDRVQLRRPQDAEVRWFSVSDIRRILEATDDPYHTYYMLAAETGMRAGELCALRRSDIDFTMGVVTAKRSVWHGRFTDTKSRRARKFEISHRMLAGLNLLIESDNSGCELIFHSRNNTPWNADDVVRDHLQPLLKKIGIAPGGMHAFRHFNGSFSLQNGAPIQTVRDRLGHSSLTVTSRYSHGVSQDDHAIAEKIGEALATQEGSV